MIAVGVGRLHMCTPRRSWQCLRIQLSSRYKRVMKEFDASSHICIFKYKHWVGCSLIYFLTSNSEESFYKIDKDRERRVKCKKVESELVVMGGDRVLYEEE